MDFNNPSLLLLLPFSAIILHELVLRRFEVDHFAIQIIGLSCVAYGALVFYFTFTSATLIAASFWIPLWLYIGAYRAFFHPLRKYPGPFRAKLSNWSTLKQALDTDLHLHRVHQELQKDYGDYVRTGIFEADDWPMRSNQPDRYRPARTYDLRCRCHTISIRVPGEDNQRVCNSEYEVGSLYV